MKFLNKPLIIKRLAYSLLGLVRGQRRLSHRLAADDWRQVAVDSAENFRCTRNKFNIIIIATCTLDLCDLIIYKCKCNLFDVYLYIEVFNFKPIWFIDKINIESVYIEFI